MVRASRSCHPPPSLEPFTNASLSRCTTARCQTLMQWMNLTTTTTITEVNDDASSLALCSNHSSPATKFRSPATKSRAAIILRGMLPPSAFHASTIRGYLETIICPLRGRGLAVDTFLTIYQQPPPSLQSLLMPTLRLVTVVPLRNSSHLRTTIASLLGFDRYVRQAYSRSSSPYELIVLTRLDLRFKQPLTTLPGLLPWRYGRDATYRGRFFFVFREGSAGWRQGRSRGGASP
jgi:hypothetical protein